MKDQVAKFSERGFKCVYVGEDQDFCSLYDQTRTYVIKGNLERNHSWESDGRDSN